MARGEMWPLREMPSLWGCVQDVAMRSSELSLVKMRAKILGGAAGMDRSPASSGPLPTLSCAQVEGREVCTAVTALLVKQ